MSFLAAQKFIFLSELFSFGKNKKSCTGQDLVSTEHIRAFVFDYGLKTGTSKLLCIPVHSLSARANKCGPFSKSFLKMLLKLVCGFAGPLSLST